LTVEGGKVSVYKDKTDIKKGVVLKKIKKTELRKQEKKQGNPASLRKKGRSQGDL